MKCLKPSRASVERVYRSAPNGHYCYELSFSDDSSVVTAYLPDVFDQQTAEGKAEAAATLYNSYQAKEANAPTCIFQVLNPRNISDEYHPDSMKVSVNGEELGYN